MSADKTNSGKKGGLFWLVCLIASTSLLSNVYLLTKVTDEQAAEQLSAPAAKVNASVSSGLQDQLLRLTAAVAHNSEQLELLVSEPSTAKSPEALAEQAELQGQMKQAHDARNSRQRVRQLLHLGERERAIALHERWMAENEHQLKLTDIEIDKVEQSGIEALERYNAITRQ